MAGRIFIAKDTFVTTLDGLEVVIHKGVTRVREGHALLKGREALFEPLAVQYDVEQATAAPAETRVAATKVEPVAKVETAAKAETKAAKTDEK